LALLTVLIVFGVMIRDATAQNRDWAAAPHDFSDLSAWAFGDGNDGTLWQIEVTCAAGEPFVVVIPPATPADEQEGDVQFDFGNDQLQRPARFNRNLLSGWIVLADSHLLDALRTGRNVRVTLPQVGFGQFGLRGSSASIERALTDCRPGSGANPWHVDLFDFGGLVTNYAEGLPPVMPALFVEQEAKAFVERTCEGPAEFSEPGAVQAAFIDPDEDPDIVVDWTRITCTNRPFSRGGGFCGMQYCSAHIFATRGFRRGSSPQSILHIGLFMDGDQPGRLATARTDGTIASWFWRNGRLVPAN
jgi:hypothetical protein